MKKEVISFSCPECSTTLRMKNRSSIERHFDCPECQTSLKVMTDSRSQLQVQRIIQPQVTSQIVGTTGWVKIRSLSKSPAAIAGLILFVVAASSLFAVIFHGESDPSDAVVAMPTLKVKQIEKIVQPKTTTKNSKPTLLIVKQVPPPVRAIIPTRSVPEVLPLEPVIAKIPEDKISKPLSPQQVEPIDITNKLQQRLLKYDQAVPITFEQFLFQFEELSGVPIYVDETISKATSTFLLQKFSVHMQSGTLHDLLKLAVSKMNLDFLIEAKRIRIFKIVNPKIGMN